MRDFITFDKSMEIVESINIENNNIQKLFLTQSLGKILAQDIIASTNNPEYETSSMDGYAFNYDDCDNNKLKIIGLNPAGDVNEIITQKNECIKTFTGSLMPKGCDTLIPIENVEVENGYIIIKKPVNKGFACREIGENFKIGEVLINKNTKIGFAHIGVMASLNISQVSVYKSPIVSVLSTGSEILDVGEVQTSKAQIRSSNHFTLEALAKNAGAEVIQLGTVKDDIENITQKITLALEMSDIVVTTGGVSVGDYDFVQDVIKDKLKAEVLFHGVKMKPGQHILLAKKDEKIIIALPGFAYSSTVCAILYLLPIIYKYKNENKSLKIIKATIEEDFPKFGDKTAFSSCNYYIKDGKYYINFEGKKNGSSAILTNLLSSSALLVQKDISENIKQGDEVDILLIDEL